MPADPAPAQAPPGIGMAGAIRDLAVGIGPRLGGSPAAEQAAAYVASALAGLGLEVESQELSYIGWEYVDQPRACVLGQEEEELVCAPVAFSGATDGPVEGMVVPDGRLIGSPRILEFERLSIVVDGRRRGALLLVPAVDGPPYPLPLSDLTFQEPSVYVSREAGTALRERCRRGDVRVRIETFGRHVPGTRDANVIGLLPGKRKGRIVVGAHYDSAWRSPGAVDNASGVAAVLELAHRATARPRRHTLEFVAFAGEEWWSFGARYFVMELQRRETSPPVRAMLNCDPLSDGDTLELWAAPDRLVGRVDQIVQDTGLDNRFPILYREPSSGSDHYPFWLAGIPVVYPVFTPTPAHYRQPTDMPETVDHERLEAIVDFLDRVLLSLDRA